jgi:pimeloyl-ACP methyl ester carboxylesterase
MAPQRGDRHGLRHQPDSRSAGEPQGAGHDRVGSREGDGAAAIPGVETGLSEYVRQGSKYIEVTLATHSVRNLLPIRSSAGINVPVLAINGADDPFFCGLLAADCRTGTTLANFELPLFDPRATVEGYVVPNTGHGLNIEGTAPRTYTAMIDFLDRHVGH